MFREWLCENKSVLDGSYPRIEDTALEDCSDLAASRSFRAF